jgi:hypothetical protein
MKRLLMFLVFNLSLNNAFAASLVTASPVRAVKPAPVKSVPDQITGLQAVATTNMSNLAADAIGDLTNNGQITINVMNSIQKQALGSPKIGDKDTMQAYLDQLTGFVQIGQNGLSNLAAGEKAKIRQIASEASTKIMALAGSNQTNLIVASTAITTLNTQSVGSSGQLDRAIDTQTNQISSLLGTIEASISSAYSTAQNNSDKSNKVTDVLDSLIKGVTGAAATAATAFGLYYAKQIGCKFGIGICPPVDPETEALIKKFKLPANVDELLERVGCKSIAELLSKSAKTLEGLKSELASKLGVAQDKINELITKAGRAAGASDEDIEGLLKKLGDMQQAVKKAVPSLTDDEILKKIGAKLSDATGQEISVEQVVHSIKAEISTVVPNDPAVQSPGISGGELGMNAGGVGGSPQRLNQPNRFNSASEQQRQQQIQNEIAAQKDLESRAAITRAEATSASKSAETLLEEQKYASKLYPETGEAPVAGEPVIDDVEL